MNRSFRVGELVRLVVVNFPFTKSGVVWKVEGSYLYLERDRGNDKILLSEIIDVIRD